MKRAGWLVVTLSLAGCLEPGDLSNPEEIYEAIGARDSGVPEGGSGGMGGSSGGMGGSSGGMGGSSGGMGGMSGGMGGMGGGGGMGSGACGDVLEDLLKPSCAMTFCHSTAAEGPLNFEADATGMHLIGAMGTGDCEEHAYVDADNPAESLIYTKLSDPPPCGGQMPFTGDKFDDEQKACVLEYIEQLLDAQ